MFVTFLSDYGPGDEYAGVVIGVIARIAPEARVIELGHGVPPQDVRTGARRLARALPYTPPGVHLAVVDPGVGGTRRALALRLQDRWLVGPDNGLLLPAAVAFGGVQDAYDVSDTPWRLEPVSATFHGRDIFGPVAAHLARGEHARRGEIDPGTLVRLPDLAARVWSTSWRSTASATSSPTLSCRAVPGAHRRPRGDRRPDVLRRRARRARDLRGLRGRRRARPQRRQRRRAARRVHRRRIGAAHEPRRAPRAPRDDRLDQRPRARAGRGRRRARHARHRGRADRGPRPPGPHAGSRRRARRSPRRSSCASSTSCCRCAPASRSPTSPPAARS